MAPFSE